VIFFPYNSDSMSVEVSSFRRARTLTPTGFVTAGNIFDDRLLEWPRECFIRHKLTGSVDAQRSPSSPRVLGVGQQDPANPGGVTESCIFVRRPNTGGPRRTCDADRRRGAQTKPFSDESSETFYNLDVANQDSFDTNSRPRPSIAISFGLGDGVARRPDDRDIVPGHHKRKARFRVR